MALPYATPDQLNQLLKKIEKEIGNGGETPINVPTKLSQLENDTGFITSTALEGYVLEESLPDFTAYALKSELPDLSLYALKTELPEVDGFATKVDVDNLIKTVGAAIQIGNEEHEININTNNRVMINSTYEVATFEPYAGQEGRKLLVLPNNDCLSGKKVDGTGVPLVFMSKWDKVEVGGSGAPLNLNGSTDRVTYKDNKEFAFVDDLERMPLICTMPFRKVSGYLGDDGTKFSKETVLGWFGVTTIDELKKLVIKKPIYLMYGITLTGKPMYYYIPCQYVAFTANNKLELITDGLDTNNDKLSRYKIVLTFVLESEATVEDTEIAITVDNYLHLPELPEDADSKTYQLKAVNGTLNWVE